jgi:hypothetical protein
LEAVSTVKSLKLLNIVLLFGVFNIKSLHEKVRWVAAFRYIEFATAEIVKGLRCITLEAGVTISHENNSVEVEEGF